MKRVALVFALAACTRREPAPAPPPSASAPAAVPPVVDAAPAIDADPCAPVPEPRTATSIGHTSVVLKLVLPDGRKFAWKPDALHRRGRYRGEIASYRLGVALGLAANVPPACVQAFPAKGIAAALGAGAAILDEIVRDGETIHGALIPWVDGLQIWPLEKEPARSEARGWLQSATIPDASLDRARQVGDLVVFDHLTTNWDRYSGGNVGLDRAGTTVLFIDNDAAFMTSPPKSSLLQSRGRLEETRRFSKALVARLEALDEASLAKALGEEDGHPLLDASAVHGLELRREEVVRAIAAQRKAHGDDATLFFP